MKETEPGSRDLEITSVTEKRGRPGRDNHKEMAEQVDWRLSAGRAMGGIWMGLTCLLTGQHHDG